MTTSGRLRGPASVAQTCPFSVAPLRAVKSTSRTLPCSSCAPARQAYVAGARQRPRPAGVGEVEALGVRALLDQRLDEGVGALVREGRQPGRGQVDLRPLLGLGVGVLLLRRVDRVPRRGPGGPPPRTRADQPGREQRRAGGEGDDDGTGTRRSDNMRGTLRPDPRLPEIGNGRARQPCRPSRRAMGRSVRRSPVGEDVRDVDRDGHGAGEQRLGAPQRCCASPPAPAPPLPRGSRHRSHGPDTVPPSLGDLRPRHRAVTARAQQRLGAQPLGDLARRRQHRACVSVSPLAASDGGQPGA